MSNVQRPLETVAPLYTPEYGIMIDRIIKNSKAHDLPLKQATQCAQTTPPWNTDMLKIDRTLGTYNKKKNTKPQIFQKPFTEIKTKDNQKFTYIYTDGSHTNTITSLAITNETEK